ncbi:MAG: S9 family peptidase [Proteobacteria bacterium]|nr:S9 family peptidase [Pseudomonadota bacterium]
MTSERISEKKSQRLLLCSISITIIGLTMSCSTTPHPLTGPSPGAATPEDGAKPPIAEAIPHKTDVHGVVLIDDYFWMRDRNDPRVRSYLEAENRYTEAVMRHTSKLQDTLYREMKSRIKETDLSVPVRVDDYWYYTRTEEGKQYWSLCRRRGSLQGAEEVLLDVNKLAEGTEFFSIGSLAVSPDHQLLAYSFDQTGDEQYTLRIKKLATGELLPDVIDKIDGAIEWANDNRTLFYVVQDKARRPYRVLRHELSQSGADPIVYQEDDERFFVSLSKSKSKKYIFVELGSQVTSEVRFLDADAPTGELRVFRPRIQGVEYRIAHHTDWFYVVSNEGAKNFKLMKTRVTDLSPQSWQQVIAHRLEVKLDRIEMFRHHMVVYQRKGGLRSIEVWSLQSGRRHDIEFDEPVYAAFGGSNPEFDSTVLRFTYTSLVTPRSVFDYDMETRKRELKKQQEVLGGYDSSRYRSERVFATATDGTRIPISLVYRTDMRRSGGNPCLLIGYGAYGVSIDPHFVSTRLSLLDRGFIYAIVHIRGGGEMGRQWYEDGKLLMKKNTFTDFIAAMEHLIGQGYTSSEELAIQGGSAGGLLIGAVVNMRPDLMKAAVVHVPFVDVINTMLDASIPLTVIEYEEWGNPNQKEYFDYIRSYSPYDNVAARDYPHLLITAGLNDPRVQYWEPAKWTAKLRAMKTDSNRLLLKTNMGAGHRGASGRYNRLHERAFDFAFILDVLGLGG